MKTAGGKRRATSSERGRAGQPGNAEASRPDRPCPGCGQPLKVPMVKYGAVWHHKACADALRAKAQIDSGETFRSQRESDWRRGGSPSGGKAH